MTLASQTHTLRAWVEPRGAENRLIGCFHAPVPGPTLVCFGGIHGNEPAGVRALEAICQRLESGSVHLAAGSFYALRGNLPALDRKVRFQDQDLNRIWREVNILAIAGKTPGLRPASQFGGAETA